MARGDHLSVSRGAYTHHGIDLGDGTVVHLTGEPFAQEGAEVRRTSMASFAQGGAVRRVRCRCAHHDADQTVARAMSALGNTEYVLATWNCEHFARWCRCGVARSYQVERVAAALLGPSGHVAARALGGTGAPIPEPRVNSSDVLEVALSVAAAVVLPVSVFRFW